MEEGVEAVGRWRLLLAWISVGKLASCFASSLRLRLLELVDLAAKYAAFANCISSAELLGFFFNCL